jgi:serine protease AprX
LDGSGVGVAVIDSGISNVDDLDKPSLALSSRVVYRENFIMASSSDDYFGHGEHVAGIIAGDGADSTCDRCMRTFRGISPGAQLIDLRVLDSNGNGADSFVIAAIQRAIQLKNTYNIRVINLSLGHPVYESYKTDPLCQAVEKAWNAGIVVVVAAGNDGRDNSFGNNGYGTIGSIRHHRGRNEIHGHTAA